MDRVHDNQTMVISGKSGVGKTLMTQTIISRGLALGIGRVFVIDRSRRHQHYRPLVELVYGARHLDIGGESEWAINAWDTPEQSVVPRSKVAFLIALHATMMGSEGLTVIERSHLGTAIREVYTRAHQQGVTARESMLQEVLLDRAREETDAGATEIAAALRNLAVRIGEFCGEGAYSYLLDRETNIPEDSPLIVFDTRHCPEEVLGAVMFTTIEYVEKSVGRYSDENAHLVGRPDIPLLHQLSMLVVDEAWHKVATEESGTHVASLARQARHIGLAPVFLSQQFSDFGTDYGLPLLRNAAMTFMLRQEDDDELKFGQQARGLSDETIGLIPTLQTVKGRYSEFLWINGVRGTSKARLALGPTEYWAFTSEPHIDVPLRNAAIAAHDGDVWQAVRELARKGTPTDTES